MMGYTISKLLFMLYAHSNTASDNMVNMSGMYTKKRGQRKPYFLDLYFEFRGKKYTVW